MIIISPSKRQAAPIYKKGLKKPNWDKVKPLIDILSGLSEVELGNVLGINSTLAKKAYGDYQFLTAQPDESVEAIYLYRGDVFKSLDVDSLEEEDIAYLHKSLNIISPLYGLIGPMTGIWPYRLEMISRLLGFPLLRDYWKDMQELVNQKTPDYIINLASNEYSACIHAPKDTKWIDIVFEDRIKGKYRVVAVKAKRMRGEFLRYLAKNKVERLEQLRLFQHKDYEFSEEVSTPTRVVFRPK